MTCTLCTHVVVCMHQAYSSIAGWGTSAPDSGGQRRRRAGRLRPPGRPHRIVLQPGQHRGLRLRRERPLARLPRAPSLVYCMQGPQKSSEHNCAGALSAWAFGLQFGLHPQSLRIRRRSLCVSSPRRQNHGRRRGAQYCKFLVGSSFCAATHLQDAEARGARLVLRKRRRARGCRPLCTCPCRFGHTAAPRRRVARRLLRLCSTRAGRGAC